MKRKVLNICFLILKILFICIITTFIIFLFLDLSPLDSITNIYGQIAKSSLSADKITQLEAVFNKDIPVWTRYFNWVRGAVTGDFGYSYIYNSPIFDILIDKCFVSFVIFFISWIISGLLGFVFGMLCAYKSNTFIGKLSKIMNIIISCMPIYWLAIVLLMIFAIQLKIVPVMAISALSEDYNIDPSFYILPIICMSIAFTPQVFLNVYNRTNEVLESDYVRFSRLQGDDFKKSFFSHIIRNIIPTFISIQFTNIAEIIGGSIIVESIFSFPGIGDTLLVAVKGGDAPLVASVTLLLVLVVLACKGLEVLLNKIFTRNAYEYV